MANFNDSAKRKYMMTHTTGVTTQTPMGQLERMYYIQYLGAAQTPNIPLKDVEERWMRKWISDHSGTAPTQSFQSDLWKAMVASIGVAPVKNTTANMMNFWLNATT